MKGTALERVEEALERGDIATLEQRAGVLRPDNFFLVARPGSGKTRIVGIRLAIAAATPRGRKVAVTSYTNTAIGQIRNVPRNLGVQVDHRHFTGTLHEFFIRYVLNTFAPIIDIKTPFKIVRDEWRGWKDVVFWPDHTKRLSITNFHYLPSGRFRVHIGHAKLGLSAEQAAERGTYEATKLKQMYRKAGILTASDALYYSYRILSEEPEVARAVAQRFDELIVDEVQDTSDVQVACLDNLVSNGLQSLVLVGDLEQSIYSFQGAAPEKVRALVSSADLTVVQLAENHRSSQRICDVTFYFSKHRSPDVAVGPNRDVDIRPEVFTYDASNPKDAIRRFTERLAAHGLGAQRSVVLARSNGFVDVLRGVSEVEIRGASRVLGLYTAGLSEGNLDKWVLQNTIDLVAELAWGELPDPSASQKWEKAREATIEMADRLPMLDMSLTKWIKEVRGTLATTLSQVNADSTAKVGSLTPVKSDWPEVSARAVFVPKLVGVPIRTIHNAKGESHESVLLVAETKKKGLEGAQLWLSALNQIAVQPELEEEIRIAYVALTRAEKFCCVALPNSISASALALYEKAGFVRV